MTTIFPSNMHNEITCVFSLEVKAGRFEQFKQLIAEIVPLAKAEPGTIMYEYSSSADGNVVHIVERYRNSRAITEHVELTFAPYAERFLSLVTVKALTVYGDPDQAARQKLDAFGPSYLVQFDGFKRWD
ncbi:antibiotic biosynthesis monooxygenase [Paraburkholderia sp. RL17-383-BIF-A]|uniref:putative quinol monooxygenase n=1 Tax=Paraburkholderia sp. RL17-383-BIF-A TaxID=3031631 RepID=UPI0038BAEB4B